MSTAQPSSSKRAPSSGHKSGSQNNFHDTLKCDSCNKSILSADYADHHVQNNPCSHNICMLCVIKKNVMRQVSSNQSACCCQLESCNQYITSCQYFRAGSPGEVITNERGVGNDDHNNIILPSFDDLGTDVVANIFGCLGPVEIMRARLNNKMRDAAKKTIVLPSDLIVNNVHKYNAMAAMTTALPNLQQLSICGFVWGDKYSDGKDPHEKMVAITADHTPHNIDIISRFTKLRSLKIKNAPLNGRYPALFNFPLLQKLTISECHFLKWNLGMLEGFSSLTELKLRFNENLPSNLRRLRVLKDTLEKVEILGCLGVEGNFMDLADFPRLKELDLRETNVRGDIRDISGHDFPALERLFLPEGVHGGIKYEFQRISDAPDIMQAIHLLLQRSPTMFSPTMFDASDLLPRAFYWTLSKDSPNWYDREIGSPPPPFQLQIIQVGSRRGWSWRYGNVSCEINWLDPEPSSDSSDYENYVEELPDYQHAIDFYFYRGYHQPPTEEEYRRLCEGLS